MTGPITDAEFEQQIVTLIGRKLTTVQSAYTPEEGMSVVRCVLIGCTYETANSQGGLWWTIGHNRFEMAGLSGAMYADLGRVGEPREIEEEE